MSSRQEASLVRILGLQGSPRWRLQSTSAPRNIVAVKNFFSGVFDNGEQFSGDHCSPGSLILVINLSPGSLSAAIIVQRWQRHRWFIYRRLTATAPITENPWQRLIAGVVDTGDKFVSGVVGTAKQFIAVVIDTADKHSFAIISANFRKKSKRWKKENN